MPENITAEAVNDTASVKGKRTSTRKIGKCTFIVSSSFKDGRERDIVSAIARLIQNETATKPGA